MFGSGIDIHTITEIRSKTTCFLGAGAIARFDPICADLKAGGIDRVVVITSRTAYLKSGAWNMILPVFRKYGMEFLLYNQITPNPNILQVDEATALARTFGAQAVIGIGGGSPIDAAKSVSILLAHPEFTCQELFDFAFTPGCALPLIAINTTHGTGTEVNRLAVVSNPELGHKTVIAYDCIYPLYAIDDPTLTTTLPADQSLFGAIDALCRATEAATSRLASSFNSLLAKEAIRLVAEYLPRALYNGRDITAHYSLLYASLLAGICSDNGMMHLTNALEHPLSAVKPDLTHGLGLGMLLPAVLETIYPTCPAVLAEIYAPIVAGIPGTGSADEALNLALGVEDWLFHLGVTQKLSDHGFTRRDINWLTRLAQDTPSLGLMLNLAPVDASSGVIESIYERSLYPIGTPHLQPPAHIHSAMCSAHAACSVF